MFFLSSSPKHEAMARPWEIEYLLRSPLTQAMTYQKVFKYMTMMSIVCIEFDSVSWIALNTFQRLATSETCWVSRMMFQSDHFLGVFLLRLLSSLGPAVEQIQVSLCFKVCYHKKNKHRGDTGVHLYCWMSSEKCRWWQVLPMKAIYNQFPKSWEPNSIQWSTLLIHVISP